MADNILEAARKSGADAIHPGYGFLSENPTFVRTCDRAGITFIGPPAAAMDARGEKTRARANMTKAGVPVVPGTTEPIAKIEDAVAVAKKIGFPIMLKAAGVAVPELRPGEVFKTVDRVNVSVSTDKAGAVVMGGDIGSTTTKQLVGQLVSGGWKNNALNEELVRHGDKGWVPIFNAAQKPSAIPSPPLR